MRVFRKAEVQRTVRIRAVVEAEVPREVAERLLAGDLQHEFTQHVFMEDWTYRVRGLLKWGRA